jgi:hypothetical protein
LQLTNAFKAQAKALEAQVYALEEDNGALELNNDALTTAKADQDMEIRRLLLLVEAAAKVKAAEVDTALELQLQQLCAAEAASQMIPLGRLDSASFLVEDRTEGCTEVCMDALTTRSGLTRSPTNADLATTQFDDQALSQTVVPSTASSGSMKPSMPPPLPPKPRAAAEIIVKVSLQPHVEGSTGLRKVRFATNTAFVEVHHRVANLFDRAPGSVKLMWLGSDGNGISLSSDSDWAKAVSYFGHKPVRLTATLAAEPPTAPSTDGDFASATDGIGASEAGPIGAAAAAALLSTPPTSPRLYQMTDGGMVTFSCPNAECETQYTLFADDLNCGIMTCNCGGGTAGEGTMYMTDAVAKYYNDTERAELLLTMEAILPAAEYACYERDSLNRAGMQIPQHMTVGMAAGLHARGIRMTAFSVEKAERQTGFVVKQHHFIPDHPAHDTGSV